MLSRETLLEAARSQTGLSDLGDDSILDALDVLLNGINTEARLTERGIQSFAANVIAALANRMRVEAYLKQHPELLQRPVDRPLFVFGLPRTGTTLAINLLSVDPGRRCFLRWEAFDSVPPPKAEELHAGPRFEKAQAIVDMSLKHAPQISAIHHENGDSPTECQFAMAPSFCAQYYDSMFHMPSYHAWLMQADYMPAFRYHKRLLQLLQAEAPGRWTLKNPWHPLFLDALTNVYPDAQLVMTHRDPVAVVGSACSLLKVVRPMFSADVDLRDIGATMVDTFEIMVQRQFAFREKHGPGAIYDLNYADLMRDPIGEMQRLYAHFGEPISAEAEAAMTGFMTQNPKGKHGKHVYALEEYGLTKDDIRARFADYCARFDIPNEK